MKKIYIEPTLDEVIIKAPTILAGSDPNVTLKTDGFVDAASVESHGDDFDWDDEEY